MKFIPSLTALFALILLPLSLQAEPEVGKPAPEFKLADSHGNHHSLSDFKGKTVVLEWTNYDCPFVKKFYKVGEMQKLQKEYTDKGVVWLSICSSAPDKQGHFTPKEIHKRMEAHNVAATAYLIDSDGKVGRLYAARTTPHMFVIDETGVLVYAGAIDDNPSPKSEAIAGAKNYVRAAIDATLAGKEAPVKTTKPYGCSVKY